MDTDADTDPDADARTTPDLVALRRDLHRHAEPAWREFYTTARIVEELRELDLDDLDVHVGPDVLSAGDRLGVPDDDELGTWLDRARDAGADPTVLDRVADGQTGAVAVLRCGDGPTVGLRVDVDALSRTESDDPDHLPAAEGFRSETPAMHACGHDAHAAIGVGTLAAVAATDFAGTLKVFFQPAEEAVGGGKPMAAGGHLDDVDYLFAVHVGLGHPTGEVVAAIEDVLAVSQFRAEFSGSPAHAGGRPEEGDNAVQAMATAIQNLYAVPRHSGGATRVNAGRVGGGTATNIVPESAFVEGEVRGETTDLVTYARGRAERVLRAAAEMHDCEVEIETLGEAPSAESDAELAGFVADAAARRDDVDSVLDRASLGGSEDATYLMRAVQERGGLATYVCVGTDHPDGHHTARFDVDEDSIAVGAGVLADAVRDVAAAHPLG